MMISSLKKRRAFTFIELVVVMGIIAILFALSVPQLFRLKDRNTLNSSHTTLVSFIREQQMRAMNHSRNYGIYFNQNSYILFDGSTFNEGEPTNMVVSLDYPVEFSQLLFPDSHIVFASSSGGIVGYDDTYHSVTLKDMVNNQEAAIEFNKLGVPVESE